MKPVLAVVGPRGAGPGEREEMLRRGRALLAQAEADDVERIDVPGRGAGEEGDGTLRAEVDRIVPALQSGSLFGGRRGLLVVDAHNLQKAEAEVVAELADSVDGAAVVACFIAEGSLPAPLARVVKERGETTTVREMKERSVAEWVRAAARDRGIRLDAAGVSALVQRFGTDTASLGRALDQLVDGSERLTGDDIIARFRNRPDEPMWFYTDAVVAGDTGEALRRLADLLTHGHPLQVLAALERDLRHRAMAAVAPDVGTFAGWLGATPEHYPVKKAWGGRRKASVQDLRRALDAIARADLSLKSAPEATHRPTMERLTVALCRWYGGRRRP
jgi:DNA polymerase-3 subunit delta